MDVRYCHATTKLHQRIPAGALGACTHERRETRGAAARRTAPAVVSVPVYLSQAESALKARALG